MADQETLLRRLARERRLLRYPKFRAAYEQAARRRGLGAHDIGQRQYERWLDGRIKGMPRPQACEILEEMFGEDVDRLFQPAPPDDLPDAGPADHGVPARADHVRDTDPPGDGPRTVEEMMVQAVAQSRDQAARSDAALGPHAMEELQADVIQLAADYMRRTPVALFTDTFYTRANVFAKLSQTRRPDQIRDLNFLAGVLCGLLAQSSIDLGQWRAAGVHALAAWTYANTIGHFGLAGWARGMQATVAFWTGRPREAVMAIQRGERYLASGGPLAVRQHSLAARAWSHRGNLDETIRAVHAAEHARANIGPGIDDLHDGIGGLFRWDTTRQEMCASTALLQLLHLRRHDLDPSLVRRLADRVAEHARRALHASQAKAPDTRSRTLETSMRLDAAGASILQGDLTGTRETMAGLFGLPAENRTYPLLYRMGQLRTDLRAVGSRWAHELDQHIADFIATAAPVAEAPPQLPG